MELSDGLTANIRHIAENAIQRYARNLLTTEALAEQMLKEWEKQRIEQCIDEEEPPQKFLIRLAQRVCSHALWVAWRSSDPDTYNIAYDNLGRYLAAFLKASSYAAMLENYVSTAEDVVQQTLEVVFSLSDTKLRDTAAFVKWTQTVLIRTAHKVSEKRRRESACCCSLELFIESESEQLAQPQGQSGNPVDDALHRELQQALEDAILSLRNSRYRAVLWYTSLAGVEAEELARRWQVKVELIYTLRYRAIQALRRNPKVMEALHRLLE